MHWALQWILASGFNTKVSLHDEDISVMQRSEFILQIISMWYKTLRVQYFDSSLLWLSATNKPFFFFKGDHYFSMLNARSVMKATYHYFYVDQCGLNKTFLCGPILFYPHFGHFNIGIFFHSTSASANMTKSVCLHVCHYQPPSSLWN